MTVRSSAAAKTGGSAGPASTAARIAGSAAFGYASKGSVIGETSSASAAEEVPEEELVAQTVLIKAAKREVTAPTPETLVELRAASQALAGVRGKEPPPR